MDIIRHKMGDVDESIDRIIEDCIRTMKEEEECYVHFQDPEAYTDSITPIDVTEDIKGDSNSPVNAPDAESSSESNISAENTNLALPDENKPNSGSEENVSPTEVAPQSPSNEAHDNASAIKEDSENLVKIQFQLLFYTREPEIWEMSITEKWRRASYHKQRGLELYARGAYQYAFRRFGLTLKYVISLEHDVPSGQEEGMDIKGLKLSCYLNVAACQMRHHNFESVVINSTKALSIQPQNAKALYRRGAAYLQLQEYEKSKEDLTAAQQLEPKNQAISKQLQVLKSQVQKLNQFYASAMKKMFS
ncbi:uncharacterized protein LOC129218154 isoform X2 [Uloborus diversus]|uniref:uncharacterized protein LOC129218154 isoform X2 n=1 Tax=Uloborus diversus TaxID=327109 RepID=UPI00240A64D4|nr:uncharacterized protein LOC129218154 isoform X2 [Uloborus diversus]